MLTTEQEQLARAVDTMRTTAETNTKLALALQQARAESAAYLAHLECSQAEVARLQEEVTALRLRVFDLSDTDTSRPAAEPAHETEPVSTQPQPSEATSPAAAGSL